MQNLAQSAVARSDLNNAACPGHWLHFLLDHSCHQNMMQCRRRKCAKLSELINLGASDPIAGAELIEMSDEGRVLVLDLPKRFPSFLIRISLIEKGIKGI